MTTLFHVAQNWLNQDPDAETRAELTALLDAAKAEIKRQKQNCTHVLMVVYNLVRQVYVDVYKLAQWG